MFTTIENAVLATSFYKTNVIELTKLVFAAQVYKSRN